MCRIFAAVLKEGKVSPILKIGLKRLEYGGYDSSGMATISDTQLQIKKGVGKLEEVDRQVNFESLEGMIGIAHNRWATHGYPTVTNAHPQTDCKNQIAVVHNGVIENFMELKAMLIDRGHEFRSRTDTEVVAHLVEDEIAKGRDFVTACAEAVKRLSGSYALAILYSKEPDKVVLIKKESPLYIGVGVEGNYAASDPVAFVDKTNKVIPLEDNEMAVITARDYQIFSLPDMRPVKREPIVVDIRPQMVEKGGYPHYMLKEIFEQPTSLYYTLNVQKPYLEAVAELMNRARVNFLVGAGTSYHSCLAGSYMYSKLAGLPTIPVVASEFIQQYGNTLDPDVALLLVSQSGETADVLRVASYARMKASTVMAITNVVSSTITRLVRLYIVQQAGPEIGVAATKTYTSQLLVHMLLALEIARKRSKIDDEAYQKKLELIKQIPRLAESVLKDSDKKAKEVAEMLKDSHHIFYLGRGINTATAFEGRLKMLEIAYIPSSAFSAGESKHGPIALIEKNTPVIFIAPNDSSRKQILGNVMEIKSRGAKIITLGTENDRELIEVSDYFIGIPEVDELLSPILYVLPLQLLAYYSAVLKGFDPDKPRNLAKSVTVE
ncbi:MAG: glutamine--fructose-6-phosphate transaminase (isomerizing) [Nitrososphaeria archaeon]